MATVKEINHDSSTTLSDFYDDISDADSSCTVTVAAALDSSTNGLNTDYDAGGSNPTLIESLTLSSNDLRMRVIINLANVTYSDGVSDNFAADFALYADALGSDVLQIRIMGKAGGSFAVRMNWLNDSSTINQLGSDETIASSGEVCIDFRAIRETTAISNDGELEFFIDGVSKASATNLNNFTKYGQIDKFRFVADSNDADFAGDLFSDQFIITDDESTSLCGAADLLTLSIMPSKVASIDASGTFIYLALLNNGTPIISKISTALNADGLTVFDPGAGDAIGVECGRFDVDVVWIAGNFDSTNVVEKSEDAGVSFVVKDDTTIGDVRAFILGTDSDDKLLIFDETNGDILETRDGGAIWITINASVTPEINAIGRLGENTEESVFGNDGSASNSINYSVNSGDDLEDFQTGVFPNENVTGVIVN